jgi:histidine triad (HIT) family protein
MPTLFARIVRGEIPCHKIAETERALAFLDVMPVREGHTLVIPKDPIDDIFDVPDDLLGDLMVLAKQVSRGIRQVVPCRKVGVAVVGLEVPHAHIHLIPIDGIGDMNFLDKQNPGPEALAATAARIRKALEAGA